MTSPPAPIDFESIVNNSADIVTIIGTDGKITYTSPATLPVLGYSTEELIGANIFTLVHPLDLPHVTKLFAEGILQRGKIYSFDVRYKHKSGHWVTLGCRSNYLPVTGIGGVLIHARDVTERRQKESEVIASREALRKLTRAVEQSPDSIVITDRNGTIEFVNPSFERVTGYTKEEAIGKNPRILQSGKTPQAVYKDMWETLLAGKTWHGELMNKKKDGSFYWESATFSPVFDDDRKITHFLAIKKDITKEKATAQEFAFKEKRFQEIIKIVSAGIIIHDGSGKIIDINPAAQAILGVAEVSAKDKDLEDPIWNTIHEDGSKFEPADYPVAVTLRTHQPQKNVMMGVRKTDGSYAWILISTVSLGIDPVNNRSNGVISSFTDVTTLRSASEALLKKTTDLERMNKMMVGRELKMIELKKKLEALGKS